MEGSKEDIGIRSRGRPVSIKMCSLLGFAEGRFRAENRPEQGK
jgi:hypothetical protein